MIAKVGWRSVCGALALAVAACAAEPAPTDRDAGEVVPDGGDLDASIKLDGGDGGLPGLPLDDACDAINTARCAYLQECGLIAATPAEAAACEAYLTSMDCGPTRWPARVRAGTLRYSPLAAKACAEDWATHPCADFRTRPLSCEGITSAAASLGGICYGGREAECKEGSCSGPPCPRGCRLPGVVGEYCEIDGDCGEGLYCWRNWSGGGMGTCATPGAIGASCDTLGRPCAEGLACGVFSTCEPEAQLGAECIPGSCTDDAFCSRAGTCEARHSAGGACADDHECEAGLICLSETGTCQSPGPLSLGASCSWRQSCAAGLTCVGTARIGAPPGLGTCATPVGEGGTCTSTWDCAQPLACDLFAGGKCGPRLGNDVICSDTTAERDCQLFSECRPDAPLVPPRCTRLPLPGEACPTYECLYGDCALINSERLCVTVGAQKPCDHDWDCTSLRCVKGACVAACSP